MTTARSRRVRLITEGNYPDTVGGVTRWCDLMLLGLTDVEWDVLALGVAKGRTSRCGTRVRYPIASPADLRDSSVEKGRLIVGDLARQLFASTPDPAALIDALVRVRNNGAVSETVITEVVENALLEEAEGDPHLNPEVLSPDAVESGTHAVAAVLSATGCRNGPVDLNLSATVGVAAVPGILDRILSGTPLVVVEHGIYVNEAFARTADPTIGDLTRRVVRRSALNLAAMSYEFADAVVGVSEANVATSRSLGAPVNSTRCIPNGVEVPPKRPPVAGRARVGSVGRVDPFKGVDLFVAAAALVATKAPSTSFVHIGPVEPGLREYGRECRQLSRRLGLADRLSFRGTHPNPPAILSELDVQVIPSRSEGLPFGLLEGMAAGRPIVATSVGGIPEALGSAGLIVDPGDLNGLAEAIGLLATNVDLARQLGAQAYEMVQDRYPLGRMLDGYRQVFESVSTMGAVA